MKLFDGNWNFDRSIYIVCSKKWDEPKMIMTRKEWAALNKEGKEQWIEAIR